MTTMIAEIYDALREAGASEEKARRAAEVLADRAEGVGRFEQRIADLRGDFAELRGEFAELRGEFAELRGEVRGLAARVAAHQGVIGLCVALEIAILVKLVVQ